MWNKEKILELKLTTWADNNIQCSTQTKIKDCEKLSCFECAKKYNKIHYENIIKSNKFDCSDCRNVREILGIDNYSGPCNACREQIKKYIVEDFKEVFNKLNEKNIK